MSARMLSIGLATPTASVDQGRIADLVAGVTGADERRARAIHELYRRSGVERRGMSAVDADGRPQLYDQEGDDPLGPTTGARLRVYSEHALALAVEACRGCLARADRRPREVTHLVLVSCTGMRSPGVDIGLMGELGLGACTQRTCVGFMGCHGAINGVRVASAIARGEPGSLVLVCCVELCSVHLQTNRREGSAAANALFADGAAACLVGGGAADAPEIRSTGSVLIPDSTDAMTWTIGDRGFEMSLSARVPDLLERAVAPWVREWLGEAGVAVGEIAGWAIHPGGPRIVDAARRSLGLGEGACRDSFEVLREHGNMSSPTVLFVLDRVLRRERGPVVALAFGPGVCGEGVLLAR